MKDLDKKNRQYFSVVIGSLLLMLAVGAVYASEIVQAWPVLLLAGLVVIKGIVISTLGVSTHTHKGLRFFNTLLTLAVVLIALTMMLQGFLLK